MDTDEDRPVWPRDTQRPADPRGEGAGLPARLAPLIHEIEEALYRRDGGHMLRSLRRLIEQTEDDDELRWLWAAAQQDLGDTLSELRPSDVDQDVEDIIAAYESASTFYAPNVCPAEYATIQNNLGAAYLERRRGAREDNLEQAISAFAAALQVRTRDADPYGWARTQNNLGNAYVERRRGGQAENQQQAIAAYRRALEVHDLQAYPYDYEMDQTNLGLAYEEFVGGQRSKNLDLAMGCFLCALLVHIPAASPERRRRLVLSLADAFHARIALTPEQFRGDVVAALSPVVEVLVEAEVFGGIPTGLQGLTASPSPSTSIDTAGASWLPEPGVFSDYRRDRYLAIPLQALIDLISSPEAEEDPVLRVDLLRAARSRTDIVLPSFRARFLDELGVALLALRSGDVVSNQEEAIEALENALTAYPPEENRPERAVIHNHLAAAFGDRISGDRAENLERAIQHCTAAVEATSPESDPATWAVYVSQLGQLYRDRRFGDPRENLTQAIDAFEASLRVWTRDSDPYQWARTKNSLGLTHLQLRPGEAAAAELAFEAFQDALGVLSRDEHPYEWAGVEFNLGRAFQERQRGDPSENIERAIEAFVASLSVLTRDRYLSDSARVQHNLGLAYRSRLAGDRAANLQTASEYLRAALEVHTRHERPADHLRTAGALGELEAGRGRWAAAHEAFASASAAAQLLLEQVTTGPHGFDDLVRQGHDVGELDAFALAQLGRAEEALAAVERGRARWLSHALTLQAAAPDRIHDAERRQRYVSARRELAAAQAAVSEVRWSQVSAAAEPALDVGGDDPAMPGQGAAELARTRALRAARERFDAVVAEIRQERDPADFLEQDLSTAEIAAGIDATLVYLLATPWGGLALAVMSEREAQPASGKVLCCDLPGLTDTFISDLVQVVLDEDSKRIIGGYGAAQEGLALNWMANQWPGRTFAEKAAHLNARCAAAGVESTLDASAQTVLGLDHPGLPELLYAPMDELSPSSLSRLGGTLGHAFLRAELHRCLPRLAEVALRPITAWLLDHGVTSMTLIPCGMLAAFPLLSAPLDDAPSGWTTVADRLCATVAPSARSVLTRPGGAASRAGVYTLGDPWPTHQELRWGEAEALTVAALGGDPGRARVREAATRQWLVESLHTGHVVSASCHGQFDGRDFLRSQLLLANGEAIMLSDLLGDQVEATGLRLLVLSACQTGVLDLRGAYGEVRSLAAGMLQAGAQAVMGSLWAVDDRATYLLMVRFAQEWLPLMREESPATALARAQAWLRTVTHRELDAWQVLTTPPRDADHTMRAASLTDAEPDRTVLVAVRGRGDRYAIAEAEELVVGLSRRRSADAADETPYADPIFWAGFQIHGR